MSADSVTALTPVSVLRVVGTGCRPHGRLKPTAIPLDTSRIEDADTAEMGVLAHH